MTKTKMTLSAIAQKAEVSIASVSRVLNAAHLTSWATQSRVHKAISLLSIDADYIFKPHSTEKSISSKKILILDNQLMTQNLINYGLENKFKQENYHVFYVRFPYSKQKDILQLIHYVAQNAFDGIIIINDAPYLKKLNDYTYALPPIILVNHFSLDFPSVYFDHLMIAHQITTYLLNNSHTRISILLSHHDKVSSTHLLHGYQQALLRANLKIEENYIVRNCFTYEHGQLAVKNLMNSSKPPTAIICTDNLCLSYTDERYLSEQHYQSPYRTVLGALHQASKIEMNHSKSISLAYISHYKQSQHNELNSLSSVYKPLYKMGEHAASLLCNLLQKKIPPAPMSCLIESETLFY